MSALYEEEARKLDVISHLEELRKRILISLCILVVFSILAFSQGEKILLLVKRPVKPLVTNLIYISPTEAFVSFLKMSILAGFIVSFPFILYQAWAFISPAVSKELRGRIVVWFVSALFLFVLGIAFSYFVAIPAALGFLLDFGSRVAVPNITLGKYISFFAALMIVGGIVFEIPVVMGLITDAGLVDTRTLRKKRHLAVIAILVLAAVITPTQDIFNMLLFALPMILLYEAGLLASRFIEARKK